MYRSLRRPCGRRRGAEIAQKMVDDAHGRDIRHGPRRLHLARVQGVGARGIKVDDSDVHGPHGHGERVRRTHRKRLRCIHEGRPREVLAVPQVGQQRRSARGFRVPTRARATVELYPLQLGRNGIAGADRLQFERLAERRDRRVLHRQGRHEPFAQRRIEREFQHDAPDLGTRQRPRSRERLTSL